MDTRKQKLTANIGAGMGIGLAVGLILGMALNSPAIGLVLGAGIGSALGAAMNKTKVNNNNEYPQPLPFRLMTAACYQQAAARSDVTPPDINGLSVGRR